MTGGSLPPSRPEPSPRMLALKIRRDCRRQRLASGASLMPALPPALDTPQHHALLWQRHPARQEAARAPFRRPYGRRLGCDRSRCLAADGKIRALRMIRGARAAKGAPSWQDLRAVYPLTAVCGAFRIHGAHILPKSAHFGCMACESYQEGAIFPSEAPFGIHGVKKLPRIAARERIAREPCHRRTPRERISRAFCHRRVPGNASGHNLAIARRPETRQ